MVSAVFQLDHDSLGGLPHCLHIFHGLFCLEIVTDIIKGCYPRRQDRDPPRELSQFDHVAYALLPLRRRMLVCASYSCDAFLCNRLFLFIGLLELRECNVFVLLLLSLKLVDQSHLLINLHQEILNMAIYIENITRDLGLDILRPVRVPESILSFIKMLT